MNSVKEMTFKVPGGPRYFINSSTCSRGSCGGLKKRFSLSTNDRDLPYGQKVKITSAEVAHLKTLRPEDAAALCSRLIEEDRRCR